MTARVLVVDDIPTNVKLLEARLAAEYFQVTPAYSGAEALEFCRGGHIDIVLLDVMMPEMDGFEVCRRLKADPRTHHIPVVMVTALDQVSDRVKGLEAGADDFLNKPVDDTQLMARVKSLVRLKVLTDELRARAVTGQQIAIEDAARVMDSVNSDGGSILLIDTDSRQAERLASYLEPLHKVTILTEPADLAFVAGDGGFELALVSSALGDHDPLRVCSQLRTLEQTRLMPIILVAEQAERDKIVRGLDLGVNDFILRPVERHELAARVKTQIKRHRYAIELRESVSSTMQLAVVDELTGLYNRRYFDRHLSLMFTKAQQQGRHMAVMMLDLDFFKSINDNHGHGAGDEVLREFALRLQRNIRGVDLACRYGGEEFVVLMPDTDAALARSVAERVRAAVADREFEVDDAPGLTITVSAGLAAIENDDAHPDALLKRADTALYRAKHAGRNRVVSDAA
ncbi:MAG: PleD family two-component system response regulator [Alphaproteobacteria bacterium]|nr:PleD family two-component system response regulator [Alphaproteobacteria bacterium]